MAEAIGPGTPLICIKSCACVSCNEGVAQGSLYICSEVVELGILEWIVHGPCSCGEQWHPFIGVKDKTHLFCPSVFGPLGDPDAVIQETSEPLEVKQHPMHWIKEPQDA